MVLSTKGSIEEWEGNVEKAVAVDMDKDQSAMKWAIENLLERKSNCVLVHFRTKSVHLDEAGVLQGSLPPTEVELKQFFPTFRGSHPQKGVLAKEVILHDSDFPNALMDYVTANSISHLIVGASSNAISRKSSSSDVEKSLLESAPEACSIYILANGTLQTVRYAKEAPQSPSAVVSTTTLNSRDPTKTYPLGVRPFPFETIRPDTCDVASYIHFASSIASGTGIISDTSCSGKSSDFTSYSWQKTEYTVKPTNSHIAKSSSAISSSEVSDFSVPLSFQSTDRSSLAASSESGHSPASISSNVVDNVEDELAKLHLQFEESLSVYNKACQDAAAAEQKALEIQRMKISQLRSSEEDRPPRKDSCSTLTDIEKMKERDTLMGKEMVSKTEKEIEGQRRFSEPASNKDAETVEKKHEPGPSPRMNVCYRKYTIEQIEEATEYFSSSQKIDEGGYGPVYKATLDHTSVAIKVLRPDVSQGLKQFNQEVEILSCMRHPNMVILVGACPEYGCLVYEYMDNGTLEDRLFCKGGTLPIPWRARFRIAAEIATGLAFLHQAKPEPVVHRDIKPSNILLDRNYMSKIGDVGLARLVPISVADKMAMTMTAGTFCYIDPEYQQTGMLGVMSDVYSLGVVLLQIITARPPMGLTQMVEDAIESGLFPTIVDQRVTDWPMEETLSLAKLALKCCKLQRKDRPDLASEVLPALNRIRNRGLENGGEKKVNDRSPQEHEQDPEVMEIRPPPSQINVSGRWQQRFKSMAGGWNLKSSFKRPRIFPLINRKQQPEKQDQVFVEGCWSFVSCSKSAPQLEKFKSFS